MTRGPARGTAATPVKSADVGIAIVDENVIFRAGLVHFLSAEDAFTVVMQTATVREAAGAVGALQPEVVLVGVDRVTADVPEDLTTLRAAAPLARVVVLLAQEDPLAVKRLLTAGVQAAIPRQASPQELAGTIRGIVQGADRIVLSVARSTLACLRAQGEPQLTAREREIVALVARGLRNSQIARHLVITEGTVKRHLSNAYAKLDASCRTEAVRKAAERGMIPPVMSVMIPPEGYEAAG
ncbi:response regulator transcription factor [Streptoverticillium reticulum]|uniref:response regulator transcription factor n=1 Tax=Streptoverticillium reticulum TaxID=1433415 RepID=UPI0039BF8107